MVWWYGKVVWEHFDCLNPGERVKLARNRSRLRWSMPSAASRDDATRRERLASGEAASRTRSIVELQYIHRVVAAGGRDRRIAVDRWQAVLHAYFSVEQGPHRGFEATDEDSRSRTEEREKRNREANRGEPQGCACSEREPRWQQDTNHVVSGGPARQRAGDNKHLGIERTPDGDGANRRRGCRYASCSKASWRACGSCETLGQKSSWPGTMSPRRRRMREREAKRVAREAPASHARGRCGAPGPAQRRDLTVSNGFMPFDFRQESGMAYHF